MRCHICDKQLTDQEVSWNKDLEQFEPCTVCLDIALDAAYSDGFRPDGELDPEAGSNELAAIEDEYGSGETETLDPGQLREDGEWNDFRLSSDGDDE